MTIQLVSTKYGKSKATLAAALEVNPRLVSFFDPAVFGPKNGGPFTGQEIAPGERILVVLDPVTRRRFAEVARKKDGAFTVR